MSNKAKQISEMAAQLSKTLVDQGKLMEGGFAVFAHYILPKDAPKVQYDEMCLAYMAGAEHLFGSIMGILEPGVEPTDADFRRMDLIAREIDEWRIKLSERVQPAQGSA